MFESKFATPHTYMLTVRNRTKVLYKGQVKAVTSMNAKGKFDILAEHTNFISIITDFLIIHEVTGETKEIKLTRGVLKVSGSLVTVYLGVVHTSPPAQPQLSK